MDGKNDQPRAAPRVAFGSSGAARLDRARSIAKALVPLIAHIAALTYQLSELAKKVNWI